MASSFFDVSNHSSYKQDKNTSADTLKNVYFLTPDVMPCFSMGDMRNGDDSF